MITSPEIRIHERQLVHVTKHTGSVGLSNVQQGGQNHIDTIVSRYPYRQAQNQALKRCVF